MTFYLFVFVCRSCGGSFQPGARCFHGLCGRCFEDFDTQRFIGRMALLARHGGADLLLPQEKDLRTTESVDEWISMRRARP